jgi:hypothetical protein
MSVFRHSLPEILSPLSVYLVSSFLQIVVMSQTSPTLIMISSPVSPRPLQDLRQRLDPSKDYVGGGEMKPSGHKPSGNNRSDCQWHPTVTLPFLRSTHPLDVSCLPEVLQQVHDFCLQDVDEVVAPLLPLVFIQVKHLRTLISYSSMISDMVITYYLERLSRQYNLHYLSTSFLSILRSQGWNRLKRYFSNHHNKPRGYSRPRISGELAIILPCFVDGCHWVTVVRREVNGQVLFLYADDLNQYTTEQNIKLLLSQHTSPEFYPTTTKWVNCTNYTYRPHSNECGPRSLLAATILALHLNPTSTILLPAMHPNSAQILRSWLSCQILNQEIDTQAINALLEPSQPPIIQRRAISKPADLIQWTTPRHGPPPMVSTTHKPSASSLVMESKKLKSMTKTTKALNPLASPFQPNFQPAILPQRESVVNRVTSIPSMTKLNNKLKAKLKNCTSTLGPAK